LDPTNLPYKFVKRKEPSDFDKNSEKAAKILLGSEPLWGSAVETARLRTQKGKGEKQHLATTSRKGKIISS